MSHEMDEAGGRGAADALHEFTAACCVSRVGGARHGGGRAPALVLAMAPPSLLEEYAHEDALDFVFADEMKVARQLQGQADAGRALLADVYCSRSCARAIPTAAADAEDASAGSEYYRAVYDVLYPQVAKIKQVSDFCSKTGLLLSDAIQRLTVHENASRTIPDALADALLDVLDVVMQLSHLHNAKSSLRNDFSVFKRIYLNVKARDEDAERLERDMARLQEFVGSSSQPKGSIWASLEHNLANIKRFDQVAFLLLKRCVNLLENSVCMAPAAHFKHLRLTAHLRSVLEDLEKTAKGKTLGIDRKLLETASKLGSRYPIVPIFAELSTKSPKMAAAPTRSNKSGDQIGTSVSKTYDIAAISSDVKASCEEYLSRLFFATNLSSQSKATQASESLFETMTDGIKRMSEWKTNFLLFLAYKQQVVEYNNQQPTEDIANESSVADYERAIEESFTNDEWLGMVDIIHCTKSVVNVLRQFFVQLVGCARRCVYSRIQEFVQRVLLPILHRADKRNLACTKLLHDLRLCCGDWDDSTLLADDFKKRRKERKLPKVPEKTASISQSQLQLIRTIVDAIYSKRSMAELNTKLSAASSLFSFKRELNSADIEVLSRFYHDSSIFPSVLALEDTLKELQDFSALWFRELQLELTQAIQFPTAASLPWLLVERGLSLALQLGVEPTISLLDVYNDAAYRSVFELKKRFLYDEAIAEGSMCYDFLVHSVSDQTYLQAKSIASVPIDPEISNQRTAVARGRRGLDPASLTHRIVNVFGVNHRVSAEIALHVNSRVRRDLVAWVKKLERSGITSISVMERQLRVYQRAHHQLRSLSLTRFEDLLDEVLGQQHSQTLAASKPISSRVHRFIARALLSSLCQRFSVEFRGERFVQSMEHPALLLETEDESDRYQASRDPEEPKQFSNIVGETGSDEIGGCESHEDSSFGPEHVKAISAMLRHSQVLQLADDCIEFAISKIEDVLSLCIPALGSAIPPYRLPRFMYRAEGCFGYFEGKFKHMLDSDELEAQVLHCFREIGNALMFLLLLDEELATAEAVNTPTSRDDAPGIFLYALERVHDALIDSGIADEWHASVDSCPDALANPCAFYHVWSAIEFISCCRPQGDHSLGMTASRDLFGDGLQIAGCVLIHLLDQRALYELWNVSQHVLDAWRCDQARSFASSDGSGSNGTIPISPKAVSSTPAVIMASHKRWKKAKASAHAPYESSASSTVGTLDQEMKEKARAFLSSAQQMRDTSARIFHVLERFWPTRHASMGEDSSAVSFTSPAFHPPAADAPS